MAYPKATRLKNKGAKIFISNAGMSYNKFVTLHHIINNEYVILDSDDLENYNPGSIEQYSDIEVEEF
ncbi:MAG: hypothetical protein ACK5XN_26970 [Bacteroidota bacterium]|jgi:hypothetical protein